MGKGGLGTGSTATGLQDDDGLPSGDARRRAQKLAPALQTFHVDENDLGLGVRFQVFQHVHEIDVASVSDIDGLAHAMGEAFVAHLKGTGLNHQGEGLQGSVFGDIHEGRGEARKIVQDPHGVGPDHPGVVLSGEGHHFILQLPPPVVGIRKTLTDDQDVSDTFLDTFLK
jgi:hypothetical protein